MSIKCKGEVIAGVIVEEAEWTLNVIIKMRQLVRFQ